MPTREELRNELINDPAGIGYAPFISVRKDATIADLLNQQSFSLIKPLPNTEIMRWAALNGVLTDIYDTRDNPNIGKGVRAACIISLSLINNLLDTIDLSDPEISQLFVVLINNGIISTAQRGDLLQKATKPASRAEVLWGVGTVISHRDVAGALME